MKTAIKYFIASLALSSVLYMGCKKDTEETPIPSAPYSVYALFEKYGAKTQTYQVDLDTVVGVKKLIGEKGCIIRFIHSPLLHSNGSIVTGIVNVELKEIYSKKDILLSNVPTVSNENALVSGGEIFLRITQNGEELVPYPNHIRISIPAGNNPDTDMMVYYGKGKQGLEGDTTINNRFSWALDSLANVNYGDTLNCYSLYPTKFNWINCDHPLLNNVSPQPITIAIPDTTFKPNNIYTVISIDQVNTAINVRYNYGTQDFTYVGLPAGYAIHVVCIAQKNSQYYFSSFPYTVQTGSNHIPVNLQPANEATIVNAINNLP